MMDNMFVKETVAYFCWACGGIFGLHHFYLQRDIQAFVWFTTLGGGLIGWLSDFRKIPEYVKEANGETRRNDSVFNASEFLNTFIRRSLKPKATWTLYFGQLLMGVLFSTIARYAIPTYYLVPYLHINYIFALLVGVPIAGAMLGVYLATNLDRYSVRFIDCFSATGISYLVFSQSIDFGYIVFVFFTAHSANAHLKYPESKRIKKEQTAYKHLVKRSVTAVCCCVIYLALLLSAVKYNRTLSLRSGNSVTLLETVQEHWMFYRNRGLSGIYKDSVNYLDPVRKYRSYWVLGYRSPWMDEGELKSYCRRLAAQWHPDKYTSIEDKVYADTHYKTITNACDILKKLHKKR